eukprot:12803217-Alexandrium_andersonii.AAC.1
MCIRDSPPPYDTDWTAFSPIDVADSASEYSDEGAPPREAAEGPRPEREARGETGDAGSDGEDPG